MLFSPLTSNTSVEATVSDSNSSSTTYLLFDGDTTTSLSIDLSTSFDVFVEVIGEVYLNAFVFIGDAADLPTSISIASSVDGTSYSTVGSLTVGSEIDSYYFIAEPITHRFLKFTFTGTTTTILKQLFLLDAKGAPRPTTGLLFPRGIIRSVVSVEQGNPTSNQYILEVRETEILQGAESDSWDNLPSEEWDTIFN